VVQDIKTTLFLRKDMARLGLAPMTSMFCFDEAPASTATTGARKCMIPMAGDLDGHGERIWRPLENPSEPRTNTFAPIRSRRSACSSAIRSSITIRTTSSTTAALALGRAAGGLGAGRGGALCVPDDFETVDNIAAFWLSDRPARAGERRDFAYRLTWTSRSRRERQRALCPALFGSGRGSRRRRDPRRDALCLRFRGRRAGRPDRSSGLAPQFDLPARPC
jgi:glucans biosynthesis protein